MKHFLPFLMVILVGYVNNLSAQNNAHPSAALEIDSSTKGFLPPRMTTVQRNAIPSPALGLTIFNTSTNKLNVYDGFQWVAIAASSSSIARSIRDEDGNTQIQVEEGTNDDTIRFDVAGTEVLKIDSEGIVQGEWQSAVLQNGWENLSSGTTPVQYMKDANGTVFIRGFIVNGTTTNQTIIFNLPVGYRPNITDGGNNTLIFPVFANGSFGSINIFEDGNVKVRSVSSALTSLVVTFSTN